MKTDNVITEDLRSAEKISKSERPDRFKRKKEKEKTLCALFNTPHLWIFDRYSFIDFSVLILCMMGHFLRRTGIKVENFLGLPPRFGVRKKGKRCPINIPFGGFQYVERRS
jgi:hypothetical protein